MRPRLSSQHVVRFLLIVSVSVMIGAVVGCATPEREIVRLPAPIQSSPPTEDSEQPAGVLPLAGPQAPRSLQYANQSAAPTIGGVRDSAPTPTVVAAPAVIAPAAIASPPLGGGGPSSSRALALRTPVDAMVGQINGRPLFASDFFSSMDARLRAEAARRTPEDWLRFARSEIRKTLRDRIRDELLLAEVESSLTDQQRAGLVNFVRSLRDNFISENRGSEALAGRRFLEEQGITLEEAVQARRDEELIRSWLRRILQNKIYVPWRDVKQRYERDRDVYNPPAKATFRMIRVSAKSVDDLDAVKQGLAAKGDFKELAREHSRFNADEAGLYEAVVTGDSYKDSELFGIASLNNAAHALTPGDIAGPLDVGANVYWIQLESIDTISQSLYEVQMKIQREIYGERVLIAQDDYFNTLLEQSGLQTSREIDRMESRLFEIAAQRYLLSRQD